MMAFLTCSSPSPVKSKLIGVPEGSGVALGVAVGVGVSVGVGVGVGGGVGVGVGVGVGLGVTETCTISFRGVGGRISVQTIAPLTSSSTAAPPPTKRVVREKTFFLPV